MREKLAQPVDDIIHWTQGLLDSVYGSVTVLQVRQELALMLLEARTVQQAVDPMATAVLNHDVREGINLAHQCATTMSRLMHMYIPLFHEKYGERLKPMQRNVLNQIDREARLMFKRMAQIKAYLQGIAADQPVRGRYFYLPTFLRLNTSGKPDESVDRLTIAPRVGEVYGDPVRVGLVLLALLDNAWAFAPYGEVRVIATQPDDYSVHVRVQDQGRGIPLIHCERIFEPFYQIDPTVIGLGLGLTIADATVRHWGGDLYLDSSVHDGAAFVFTLPVGPPA